MTIGVFDGVHRGHAALVSRVASRGPNPTVVTFRENPKKILSPHRYEGDIFSLEQRLSALEGLGAVRVILIDFSEEFSTINGWDFINLLEDQGGAVFLAVGSNFRCGYRHETGAELIKQRNALKGIPTEIVQPVMDKTGPVSSSRIRAALAAGDLTGAGDLLGRKPELDLSGIRGLPFARDEKKGLVYDAASFHRITPPDGTYPVFIRAEGFNTPPLGAVKEGIKPRVQAPFENNIPRPLAAGLLIGPPDAARGRRTEVVIERGRVFVPFSDTLKDAAPGREEPGLRVVFE
jgi:riboflavin kinase/FMN adenylyltransferase